MPECLGPGILQFIRSTPEGRDLYLEDDENLPGKLGAAIVVARKSKEGNRLCAITDYRLGRVRRGGYPRSVDTSIVGGWELLRRGSREILARAVSSAILFIARATDAT